MARINGINSDYILGPDGIVEVPPSPGNLDLKLFLCPYKEPNGLEATSGTCTGTDAACPHAGAKTGHALVHLSETQGIRLATDAGTHLQLHQNSGPDAGKISLRPAAAVVRVEGSLELSAGGHTFHLGTHATGVQLDGALQLVAGGHTLSITPSATGITVQHANGARVVFKPNGDLDLITKNNTGVVTIQGNLVVSGTLSRQGQIL